MWQPFSICRPVALTELYTAFEQACTPDFLFRGETHDFYELVLLLEGCVGITAGATSFTLEAPAAVLHPPMEFHSIRSANGTSPHFMIFTFGASAIPAFEKRIFPLETEQIALAQEALEYIQTSTVLRKKMLTEPPKNKDRLAALGVLTLEKLLLTLNEVPDFAKKDATAGGRHYRHALRTIEENLHLPLNITVLAKMTHISESLLKKTFARHAGVGVMEYVRTRKAHAAIPLLREGVGVQEIATRLGFANTGYFSTVFRRVTGHTPGYYRNH